MPSTPPECSPDPSPQTAVGPTPACPLPTLALLANPNPQSVTNAQPDFPPAYSLDPESSSSISSAGHPSSPSALATRPDALPPGASTLPSSTSSSPTPPPPPAGGGGGGGGAALAGPHRAQPRGVWRRARARPGAPPARPRPPAWRARPAPGRTRPARPAPSGRCSCGWRARRRPAARGPCAARHVRARPCTAAKQCQPRGQVPC